MVAASGGPNGRLLYGLPRLSLPFPLLLHLQAHQSADLASSAMAEVILAGSGSLVPNPVVHVGVQAWAG